MLVELVVIIVTVLRAEQFQVSVADYDCTRLFRQPGNVCVAVKLAGVLKRLVIAHKAVYYHAVQAALLVQCDVEVSYYEVGEVEPCKLEKQLVAVNGVGLVHEKEREWRVAFGNERASRDGVAVVEHHRAAFPHIAYVELSAIQRASGFYTVDNHSGHFAHVAFGIFADEFLHVGQASLTVAAVELAQSADEYEFVTVGSEWETRRRQRRVGRHLVKPVSLEGVVRCGVKRVFNVYSETCVDLIIRVCQQRRPLAFREIALEQGKVCVGLTLLMPPRVQQEEVVISLVHVLVVLIIVGKAAQVLLAQREIVELVLEDNA